MSSHFKLGRPHLFLGLCLVTAIFLAFMHFFQVTTSPKGLLHKLEQENKIKILTDWQVTLLCRLGNKLEACSNDEERTFTLKMPNPQLISKHVAQSVIAPSRAHLRYNFNQNELEWLMQHPLAALVIPDFIHHQTTLHQGDSASYAIGFKATAAFPLEIRRLLNTKEMTLDIDFKGYPIFGPDKMLPLVLVSHEAINDFSSLPTKYFMSVLVLRGQEFTLFLLLAAMALILDHSLAFGFLSMYILGQSGRHLFYFFSDAKFDVLANLVDYFSWLIIILHTLTTIALPLFIAAALGVKPKKSWVLGLGFVAFLCLLAYMESAGLSLNMLDIYGDLAAAFMGIGVITYVLLIKPYLDRKKTSEINSSKDLRPEQAVVNIVFTVKNLLLISLLTIKIWINIDELLSLNQQTLKDILDWKQYIHFPGLVLVALIDVGSTSKAMYHFAKKMVHQALMEKDLALGKAVQESMLPLKKHTAEQWSWRCFYFPSTTLAGDWYDLKELKQKDGSPLLMACVVDVTGHGIAAAMMTSIISSVWERYTMALGKKLREDPGINYSAAIKEVVQEINEGLLALRGSKGCTLACLIYSPQTQELTYTTPGHPGILMQNGSKAIKYLAAPGSRLGGSSFKIQVNTEKLDEESQLILFTDGLAAPKQSLNQWLKSCTRACANEEKDLRRLLLEQARHNKQHFRKNPDDEDDMTMLVVTIKTVQQISPAKKAS